MATKSEKSESEQKTRGRRRSLVGAKGVDVLHILRDRIASSELPPGAKLNEYELAKEFDVPRTRIREAFTALEQRGLIERIPNRGAMVARLDREQVFNIYDMREVMEGLCARLACENTAPEDWQDLLDEFSGRVKEAVKNGDLDVYTEAYGRFRQRCIQVSNNVLLAQALDDIYEKTQVIIRRVAILPGRAVLGVNEHLAVLEAMRRGDAEATEQLRRTNIRNAKNFLKRYIKYVL